MRVEALARIGGKGLDIGHVAGGIPEISMDELMGALAGLDRGPELLIRAVVPQQAVHDDLYREAYMLAVSLAVKYGWKPQKGKPILRGMGKIAVDDILYPNHCRTCSGTGLVADEAGNATVECQVCAGTGRKKPKVSFSAAICGIDDTTWRRTWERRCDVVRGEVRDWWNIAERHILKQLS